MKKMNMGSGWILLLMVICGIVAGGFVGELLGKYVPMLKYGYTLGVSTHEWNFHLLKLTFGFSLNINLFSVLGMIAAYYFYRKL